ncbi:uncharacterized protein DUF4262 [Taibaiella chishuiensis]|uniref:Uncharacterized protein DUF4262 n=2 Tax=Taibaiella chishuiensis TaxID=1434707 RepID=A0A2P8CT37_9BACT|nr:uncharacterized protein DUF4262 [Taibaiella chishuiensis]
MEKKGLEFEARQSKLRDWSRVMMFRYGWYIHFVFDDEDFPYGINFHTHGIEDSFAHPDLQICFPIPQEMAHLIFNAIVGEIKKGFVFKAGRRYADIIGGGLSLNFIPVRECGRPLLRIIFTDENGGSCRGLLTNQFTMTGK